MAANYMSMDHLRFLLFHVHDITALLQNKRFQDYDKDGIGIILNAAKDMADQELFPYFQEMDEQPVHYKDGKVIVHPQIEKIIQLAAENGWIGTWFDADKGGMQMPKTVFNAANHIFQAANNSVVGYLGLTTGSASLINTFGSQELQDTYVPNMLAGKWMGTMALTEPQAGSSLSDLTTTASPTEDGYYKIKGQKIFISGGDHEYADNFIHLTLARIEGAPAGTKGISLFVVPKHRPTESGSLENNDVITAGDFQKMGQKGYATTHLVYGEQDDCQGWLVGEPNRGLKYMFQMMNGARIDVGLTAASTATAAYYASLQYAKERPQGRKINKKGEKDLSAGPTLIINHPDVRRMLLLQKSVVEGSLSLLMFCSKLEDLIEISSSEEKQNHHLLLEFLTPIAKTYPAEMGQVSISNGLQVLGGYGFCSDFPLQQYYRDVRIMSLYEGTTGIQSLDLLGRKSTMENGRALQLIMGEIQSSIQSAMSYDLLKPFAMKLGKKLELAGKVITHLMGYAQEGDFERFLADATIFMQFTSTLVIAWQWLVIATKAQEALLTSKQGFTEEFYESKFVCLRYFYKFELPKMESCAVTLLDEDFVTLVNERELIV